jgi:hypothetical protein
MVAAGLKRRQDRLDVLFHEQHRRENDVARGDVGFHALDGGRIVGPLRRHVDRQIEPRKLPAQRVPRTVHRAGEVPVQGDDDDPDGRRVSGRSELWHRRAYPQ